MTYMSPGHSRDYLYFIDQTNLSQKLWQPGRFHILNNGMTVKLKPMWLQKLQSLFCATVSHVCKLYMREYCFCWRWKLVDFHVTLDLDSGWSTDLDTIDIIITNIINALFCRGKYWVPNNLQGKPNVMINSKCLLCCHRDAGVHHGFLFCVLLMP